MALGMNEDSSIGLGEGDDGSSFLDESSDAASDRGSVASDVCARSEAKIMNVDKTMILLFLLTLGFGGAEVTYIHVHSRIFLCM
jgi:hypothetical protein